MRLVVLEVPNVPPGTRQAQQFDFDIDPDRYIWIIGRQLGSDIHLVDPSVSRRHAELEVRPDGFLARDLGSSNGTFVNDQRLQPYTPKLLRPGDRLRVGNVLTLLEEGSISGRTKPLADINIPAARPVSTASQDLEYMAATYKPQSPRGEMPPAGNLKSGILPDGEAKPNSLPAARTKTPHINPPGSENRSANQANRGEAAPDNAAEAASSSLAAFAPPPPPPAPPPQLFNTPGGQPNGQPNAQQAAQPGGQPPAASGGKAAHYSTARGAARDGKGEYYPPVQAAPHISGLKTPKPAKEPRRFSPLFIIIPAIVVLVVAVGLALFLLVFQKPAPSTPPLPGVTLPIPNFKSQSSSENVLDLNLAHPTNWKRNDVSANQVIFYQPDETKTLFNLEKPPSASIANPNLTPEAAILQYVGNVRQGASKYEVKQEPGTARLRDGTPAVLARLVFSTATGSVVTDYNMYAVSFKCGNTLYFASAAAEAKNYNDDLAQDLNAAIGSLTCSK